MLQTPSMRGMDLKTIFNAISFERQCGHGKNMTYHEYMTAAMHNRCVYINTFLILLLSI
jgi:hypothetical protein